ncbi:MAG: S-layer homology domain-containing protein, partial [Clostridia bacterium]|nr:S-layer homology domain-containing protein [Clostridia bacterium]
MNARKILSAILALLMLTSVCVTGVTAEEKLPFTDVPAGEWYYDAVAYTYGEGLMNGTGNGSTFSPMMNLTRGMVVTVLFRNDGSPNGAYVNPFADVDDGQYYAKATAWAYGEGVVTGTGEDIWGAPLFSPDRNITRQELATMFARYAAYKHVDTEKNTAALDSFPDNGKVASWAADSFKWSAGTGIITGKQNGGTTTLSPEDLATRAEFAIMIQRYNVKDDAREFTYKLAYEIPVIKSQYTEPKYELVETANIYVAVDGLDTNPGTKDKPLGTFEGAKAAVRKLIKEGKKGEIVVAFMGGDYGVLDNITFTEEDSGSADVKITYCAYGDDDVYFTNGVFIEEGDFKALDESDKVFFNSANTADIKKVDLSGIPAAALVNAFSTLANDGSFCWQARTPNKRDGVDIYYPAATKNVAKPDSPYTMDELMAGASNGTFDGDFLIAHTVQNQIYVLNKVKTIMDSLYTTKNVQLSGYISKVWHQDALNISAYDKETGLVTFSNTPAHGFVNVYDTTNIYINNASTELDDIGEYWINEDTMTLYVYKPAGTYTISTNGTFVTINEGVNHISFTKLNFRACDADAIGVYGDDFTMDQCTVTYVGGSHAFHSNGSLNIKITNSTFAYCAETGVYVRGPRPGKRAGYDYYALNNTGFVFRNNLVHDVDLRDIPVESGGLAFSYQIGADVSHNEIYNSARYGIDFKYGNIECIMEYNYLHHCMQNSADGGAFYCGRVATNRGNVIRYNLVSEIVALNPMHTGGTYCIYMDDYQENVIIHNNIFYNAGNLMNNNGRSHEIYDNVFIKNCGISGKKGLFFNIADYAKWSESFTEGWNALDIIPAKDTANGQLWESKWPELYDMLAIAKDPSCYEDTDLYDQPLNYCHNNYVFGGEHNFEDGWVEKSDHENNTEYSLDVNPIFTDPTHGDYSIREGASFTSNHYELIG